MRLLAASLLAVIIPALAGTNQLRPANLGLRDGPHSLPSPDGAYILSGDESHSRLWLENVATHHRDLVMSLTIQTSTVSWSPDSHFFVVNDRPASGWEDGYVYDVHSLERRLDLRKLALAADRSAARIVANRNTSHAYVHATGWLDQTHLQLELNGRTDSSGTPERIRLGHCFDLRYRVSLNGTVEKLSQRFIRVDRSCGEMDAYEE